ncbi:MAG: RHS repeat-associated core domain-containing protein, partial [Prevotella sp.]|nr:RHS repeat-associated core domain-containing protein [Prevotella sp.]
QPSPGRVNSVSDGLGRTTAIGYQLLTNPSVYHKVGDLAYPVVERLYPLAVVSSTTMSDGAAGAKTTKRTYSGLKTHVAGRGLMGFSGTTAACSMLGTEEITTVSQWDDAKYIPTAITTKDTQGDATATTETTLTKATVGNNYFTYPSVVISTDADGNICTTTSTYDTAKGVPLTQKVSHDGGATYRQTTCSDYAKKGGRWLPQTVITEQKHPDDASIYTATQKYTYDDRGMPLTATSFAGTSMALTETYTYDIFGNCLTAEASGADVTPVKKILTYDANGRYLTSECTQPATDATYYYYDIMGNLVKEMVSRASSLITNYTYDGWGTLLTSTSPTGITTTYSEGWGISPSKRYWRMEQTSGQPWRKTWYDQCGREVLAESVGPDGMTATTATTYNSHGKPTLVSNTMGLLTSSETFSYDSRDRLTSTVASTGRTVSYAYAGRSVTTTENGHVRTRTVDAWGNVLTSVDSLSSVAYTYYSSGLPHTATCGDATVTMTYDAAGHRTTIDDPDAGLTTSTWSADGRLLTQTDARGVETAYEYNNLGLVTAQHIGSQTVTSTYGSAAGSKTLPSTMSMGGNTVQYGYDSKDRMVSQKRTFADGTTLSFAYAYNANDQPVQAVFPGGLTVGYEYDAYGYCISMTADGQEVYRLLSADGLRDSTSFCDALWHVTRRDALGYLKKEKWGHNDRILTSRTYTFDGPTGNLTSRILPSRAYIIPGPSVFNAVDEGNALQNIGSILPISDSLKFGPDVPVLIDGYEEFTYDGLDRLTRVGANKELSIMTIRYGSDGNILSKTDVGDYSYDAAMRPHAVIGVTNQKGIIPSAALETTYGDLNKINMISNGTYETTFSYGPDQERWLTVEKKNDTDYRTIHYAPGIERVTLGGVTRTFFYLGHGVIVMQQGSTYIPLLTVTDHQGTIAGLVDATGTWQFDANYDAWGRQTVAKNSIGFQRGYTGHEMLPEYGLINMNGRLYDPLLGRFLSPDNYVQQPDNSQSFNRYSYCLNNPLKYTDPDGEWIHILIGGVIGGVANLTSKAINGQIHDIGDGLAAFGIGAAVGAIGAATGGAAFAAAGGAVGGAGGFFAGAVSGGVGSAISMPFLSAGNSLYFGDPMLTSKEYLLGIGTSALMGGAINGAVALYNGRTFWSGKPNVQLNIQPFEPVPVANSDNNVATFKSETSDLKRILSPYEKGQVGVNRAIEEFRESGGVVLQREVTVEVDGVRNRFDFVGKKGDMIYLYEVKNGPKAGPTPNQLKNIPKLMQGVKFIPIGANAAKIQEFYNYELLRIPYTGKYSVVYLHYY